MTIHKIDREKLAEKLAYDDKCYPHAKCNETIKQAAENWLAMEWQPIETAPRDGTGILIPDNGGMVVFWEVDGLQMPDDKPGWTNGYFDKYEDNFVFYPTHWMPLPQPPEDKE